MRSRSLNSDDHALEAAILELLNLRGPNKTICPSEAAKQVACSKARKDWEPLMEPARDAALRLVSSGRILITQHGHPVNPATIKGPIRLRLRENEPSPPYIAKSSLRLKRTMATGKKSSKKNPCWPGFEPVPGKQPRTRGSCRPKPGPHSKATKRATQRSAAASKLARAGKPNPNAKKS